METNNPKPESDYKDSLLYKATKEWDSISQYRYSFIYGFKKKLYTILLTFAPEEFYHLAGFQYLSDLSLPRYNARKMIRKILEGEITQDDIEKGADYESLVKPRLQALLILQSILDSPFTLFSFRPDMYSSFRTNISADYLISSMVNGVSYVFLFGGSPRAIIRECICRSIFTKGERDYEENQRPYTVLKKTKTDLSTNQETVLFVKEGFTEPDQHTEDGQSNHKEE
ncbi:MAG: hypothetical protein IJV14_03625 [Lachnospiraceae bacterium]|nr:hypothetical protein [Lachnospiraceae bacterium]